jgi:hypothetical protein
MVKDAYLCGLAMAGCSTGIRKVADVLADIDGDQCERLSLSAQGGCRSRTVNSQSSGAYRFSLPSGGPAS